MVDNIKVSLSQRPILGATVEILDTNPDAQLDILLSPSLIFDETNWDVPQPIGFAARNDTDVEGDHIAFPELTIISDDPAFHDNYLPPIPVLILDDDE